MTEPTRVVTVTINPAIDQTLFIPNFTAGKVNRVQAAELHAGGKGINAASFLADYGLGAIATGFLGRENDAIFRRHFQQKGIEDRCIRIAGETRIGVKISDLALGQTTDINFPGQEPKGGDVERLFAVLQELAAAHEWFVLSGSTPAGVAPGIYADMVRRLKGKKVALDTSGAAFRQAVAAGPYLVKPNAEELGEFAGEQLRTSADIVRVARSLIAAYGIGCAVVSMGQDGAIFVEGGEKVWAVPPQVEVRSTVGAGDAVVAGTVAGKLAGLPLAECARLATAFSATAIGHVGHGLPPLEAVEEMRGRVTLKDFAAV